MIIIVLFTIKMYFILQETPIYPDLFLRNAIGTLFKRVILLTQNYQRKSRQI